MNTKKLPNKGNGKFPLEKQGKGSSSAQSVLGKALGGSLSWKGSLRVL